MTRAALPGVAWVSQGIWGTSPSPETESQSLAVFGTFPLLSHLLKINSGGGEEPAVTHTHKDVRVRQRRQRQSVKPKPRAEIIAFLDIIDIK